MNLLISLVAAAAVVCIVLMLFYMIVDTLYPAPPVVQPKPDGVSISHVANVDCSPDGVAITSEDRLRAAVMYSDALIWKRRDPLGQSISMPSVRASADEFARRQATPDVTLAMLERCESSLSTHFSHGYWLISSALVRESARRRGIAAHPDIHDARAP